MSEPSARLRSLIEPLVEAQGLYLFDLELAGGKLIVTVDAPPAPDDTRGGVDLAAITDATKAISRALDTDDPVGGKYVLEVTSPGVERPLRTPAHFAWAVGKEITARTSPEFEGERRYTGILGSADDDGITIAPADGRVVTLSYDDIQKARTVFDFEAELKAAKHDQPGTPGSSGARKREKAG